MAADGTDAQIIVLDLRALGFDASGNLRVVAITAGRPPDGDTED